MPNASVIMAPVVSEKSFRLATVGQYTFVVNRLATAAQVAHAIETLYKVNVVGVQTLNRIGKLTRYKGMSGQRNHSKKAIVRLKVGEVIKGFEIPTETPAPKAKAEKPAKKVATKSDVTTKVRSPKNKTRSAGSGSLPSNEETV